MGKITSPHTMAWTFVDDYALLVHADRPPSDVEWRRYVYDCSVRQSSLRGGMVMTDGFGPDATQRGLVAQQSGLAKLPFAVITTSVMAKGITTALRWLGSEIRAFDPVHIDRAFIYLDLPESSWPQYRAALVELRLGLLGDGVRETLVEAELPRHGGDRDAYVMETSMAKIRQQMQQVQDRLTHLGS